MKGLGIEEELQGSSGTSIFDQLGIWNGLVSTSDSAGSTSQSFSENG
jgi:hypothetical protein